jgi:iron(III) transport system ATP-binding protein
MSGIELEGITHAFDGRTAVRDASLAVGPGELVCLLGPSGCGKTTLLRVAAGLEPLQHGRVTIDQDVVADSEAAIDLAPEARGIGLMFQDYALFPHLTVYENITFGLPAAAKDRLSWVRGALGRVGIASYRDAYPHTLSGGQQQRVALLRAIAPEPRVLLLDEPFSGLDVTRRADLRERTRDLLKDSGIAALMVTHDPDEAMFMADRIGVMDEGHIIQFGAPLETYFQPATAYVAALFGPVNRLTGTVQGGGVRTPVGPFPAPDLADGTEVQILIRPEGLHPSLVGTGSAAAPRRPDAPTVIVRSARLLGRSSHLRLCVGPVADEVHVQAQVPGVFLPELGSEVSLHVDERQTFVFPAE